MKQIILTLAIILSLLNITSAQAETPTHDGHMTQREYFEYQRLQIQKKIDKLKKEIREKIAEKLNSYDYDIDITISDSDEEDADSEEEDQDTKSEESSDSDEEDNDDDESSDEEEDSVEEATRDLIDLLYQFNSEGTVIYIEISTGDYEEDSLLFKINTTDVASEADQAFFTDLVFHSSLLEDMTLESFRLIGAGGNF